MSIHRVIARLKETAGHREYSSDRDGEKGWYELIHPFTPNKGDWQYVNKRGQVAAEYEPDQRRGWVEWEKMPKMGVKSTAAVNPQLLKEAQFLVGWSKGKHIAPLDFNRVNKDVDKTGGTFWQAGKWMTKLTSVTVLALIKAGYATGDLHGITMNKDKVKAASK